MRKLLDLWCALYPQERSVVYIILLAVIFGLYVFVWAA